MQVSGLSEKRVWPEGDDRSLWSAKLFPVLTPGEDELDVARRARNSHPKNKAKNASAADYMHATALEAVIGYLYARGDEERLGAIQRRAMEESV